MVGGKAGAQAAWCAHGAAAEHAGRGTADERDDAAPGLRHRCRFGRARPRHAATGDLRVTFLACWEWAGDQVPPVRWGTDLHVPKGTVEQLLRGGRGGASSLSRARRCKTQATTSRIMLGRALTLWRWCVPY